MISVPSMISGRRGLLTVSSLKAKTGRRLAKPPRAARSPSRPASGRLLVGRELNLSSPTAPKKTASESKAAAMVSGGRGVPSRSMATPPMRRSSRSSVWPLMATTSCNTAMACSMISGPMPSPGVTSTFNFILISPCSSGIGFFLPQAFRWDQAEAGSVEFGDRFAAFLANLVGHKADQILVVDVLVAVGEGDEAVVGMLQLLAGQGEAELLQSVSKGGAAGVLAEDEMKPI